MSELAFCPYVNLLLNGISLNKPAWLKREGKKRGKKKEKREDLTRVTFLEHRSNHTDHIQSTQVLYKTNLDFLSNFQI